MGIEFYEDDEFEIDDNLEGDDEVESEDDFEDDEEAEDPWYYEFRDDLAILAAEVIATELAEDGAESLGIVFSSETPEEMHPNLGGVASTVLPSLPSVNEATGGDGTPTGPAILLNDDGFEDLPEVLLKLLLVGLVIHELAHVIQDHVTFDTEPADAEVEQLQSDIQTDPADWNAPEEPAWTGHDFRWIRACIHLFKRFNDLGYYTTLDHVADLTEYGCVDTNFEYYAALLQQETTEFNDVPIRDVLDTAPPKQFLKDWLTDAADCVPLSDATGQPISAAGYLSVRAGYRKHFNAQRKKQPKQTPKVFARWSRWSGCNFK